MATSNCNDCIIFATITIWWSQNVRNRQQLETYLLLLFLLLKGPLLNAQSTLIVWVSSSRPSIVAIAFSASSKLSYSISAYPCQKYFTSCMGRKVTTQVKIPIYMAQQWKGYLHKQNNCHKQYSDNGNCAEDVKVDT